MHLTQNPCLLQTWQELWRRLQNHGWRAIELASHHPLMIDELNPEDHRVAYVYAPENLSVTYEAGAHVFTSKSAVIQYIARFPYLLQEESCLAQTLLRHHWKRNAQNSFQPPSESTTTATTW